MSGYFDSHLEIGTWNFQLYFKAPPDSRIEKFGMIGYTNRETYVFPTVKILQQGINNALYLPHFLGIVAMLRYRIEFIKQKQAPITIHEAK